jgi:hypothetical protein
MLSVAIPSYKRADQINLKTLETLRRGGVAKDDISIFVVPEELEIYQTSCPGYQIIPGVLGLVQQRKFIQDYFALDTYIVFLDDDITDICCVTSSTQKKSVEDLPGLFQEMMATMKSTDSKICGIYPCDNYKFSFANPKITTDFRYLVGAAYIVRNLREIDLSTIDSLEDRERTVLYWLKYKRVLRFNHVIIKTKYFGKGGIEADDRLSKHSNYAKLLCNMYPDLLRLKVCKGYTDSKCRKIKKSLPE